MPGHNVWCFIVAVLAALVIAQDAEETVEPDLEPWAGNWFPHAPFGSSPVTEHESSNTIDIHDREHGVKMGVSSHSCDDAKTNLTVDWDFSPFDYTCYNPTNKFYPDWRIKPILECENIPKHYVAHHECMNKSITYDSIIPTYGTHRPLWPRYGEYKFVPRQRWLHSLEVMSSSKVKVLPLALVTWGCRLTMSTVQPSIVMNFIKQHALQGPEKVSKDGQYDLGLRVPAKIVSDFEDSVLCPRR
ncbi:hypothetical protein C0J52_21869 [Blattella germanica]|nr:hypothetical protein C0J52_21869 [Blattella germanica]